VNSSYRWKHTLLSRFTCSICGRTHDLDEAHTTDTAVAIMQAKGWRLVVSHPGDSATYLTVCKGCRKTLPPIWADVLDVEFSLSDDAEPAIQPPARRRLSAATPRRLPAAIGGAA
jgi:hypothetical protein